MTVEKFANEKQQFIDYYGTRRGLLEEAKDKLLGLVDSILASEGIACCSVQGRVKDCNEAVKKFVRKYRDDLEKENIDYEIKNHITDLLGLRIIIPYESEIERVRDVLANEFDIVSVTDKKKALESAGGFGYKGLHLDLRFSSTRTVMHEYRRYAGLQFEVQIRTIIQDAWSVLDHNIKYKKAIPDYLERRINSLAALFEIADREFMSIRDIIREEEHKARTEPNQWLDVFSFSNIVSRILPGTIIKPRHTDFFLNEILDHGELSYEEFISIVERGQTVIDRYAGYIYEKGGFDLKESAYVYVSLLLYWADSKTYSGLLMDSVREMFDRWCAENTEADKINSFKSFLL